MDYRRIQFCSFEIKVEKTYLYRYLFKSNTIFHRGNALPNTEKWDKIRPKWEVLVHKQGSKASAFGLCEARERAGPKDAHFPFYMQMLEWRSKWNDVKRERKYLISEAVSVKARVGSLRHTVIPSG